MYGLAPSIFQLNQNAFSAPSSSADSGAVDSLDSHSSDVSNSAVPLLLLGTAGGAPVNPVGMTPQELAKRCGLVFQFPERYFLGGTLQDVSTPSVFCCLSACCLQNLLVDIDITHILKLLTRLLGAWYIPNAIT